MTLFRDLFRAQRGLVIIGFCLAFSATAAHADTDTYAGSSSATETAEQVSAQDSQLNQYPRAEIAPVSQTSSVSTPASSAIDFPKVKTPQDEEMAKRFDWWPTDAKPGPVKDPDRSGYWWWPDTPGEARPWGNQGFIYVRKIIFDYKTAEGEMKPSLVVKRILKNVKIYFDYDKSDLRDDGINALSKALYTL